MRIATAAGLLHQLQQHRSKATIAAADFTQMHKPHTISTPSPPSTTSTTSRFASPAVFLRPPSSASEFHSFQVGGLGRASSSIVTMSRDPLLDPIFERKSVIRSQMRKQLKAMTPSQRAQEDAAIQDLVLESSWFKSSERLCAYITCNPLREVDTSKIVSEVLFDQRKEARKKLYVPRVEDKHSQMKMLYISTTEDLIANSMSILEPSLVDSDGHPREDVMEAGDPLDLVLLPGLAFDRTGNRLGRSGGYYDMFLTKYHQLTKEKKWTPPLLVALGYDMQILDEGLIPVTNIDVPVDAIVSPSGVILISSAAKERM